MFKPGNQEGKKSSRKGISNKSTAKLKATISLILEHQIEKLSIDLDSLEPKDRVQALTNLLKYILPIMKAVELEQDIEKREIPVINFTDWQ